jgi:peroxiredoxin-like protein
MGHDNYYQVKVNWKKDRRGILSSPHLQSKIDVVTPPDFPKGIRGVWSPEHLLIASVNSCLMTTFLAIAENSGFEFINFESDARGNLEKVDGKYLITEITLLPIVFIADGKDRERAIKILEKAEAACIISNSIKLRINFQPEVRVLYPTEKPAFDLTPVVPPY